MSVAAHSGSRGDGKKKVASSYHHDHDLAYESKADSSAHDGGDEGLGSSLAVVMEEHTPTTTSSTPCHGVLHPRHVLEWNIQGVTVKSSQGQERVLLRDVKGRVESGAFMAILGPSGCGKTTLLDCLSLRNRDFDGGLRLDGRMIRGTYYSQSAYVYQSEMFFNFLTVEEHLLFHAINRMGGTQGISGCKQRVEEVMNEVDITKNKDTLIGGGLFHGSKGLSGGERKRLAIATELLAEPFCLFLDEPTSGLDYVSSELVCVLLKALASSSPARIVISVMHTPTSRCFDLFSEVLLLTSDGEMAYKGPSHHLISYFAGLGLHCPERCNVADFALEQLSSKAINWDHLPCLFGQGNTDKTAAAAILSPKKGVLLDLPPPPPLTFQSSLLCKQQPCDTLVEACKAQMETEEFIDPDNSHHVLQGVVLSKSACSTWMCFKLNLWRSWTENRRDYVPRIALTVMCVILGFMYGALYYKQANNIRSVAGFLLALSVLLILGASMQVCLHFPMDSKQIVREYYSAGNRVTPYFLGRTLADAPLALLFLLSAIIPYFMVGMRRDADAIFLFCFVTAQLIWGSQSLGYLASSFSANPSICFAILPVLVMPTALFSGILILLAVIVWMMQYQRGSIPHWLSWIESLSLVNYAVATEVLNEYRTRPGSLAAFFMFDYLKIKLADLEPYLWQMVGCVVGFRALALAVMMVRIPRARPV